MLRSLAFSYLIAFANCHALLSSDGYECRNRSIVNYNGNSSEVGGICDEQEQQNTHFEHIDKLGDSQLNFTDVRVDQIMQYDTQSFHSAILSSLDVLLTRGLRLIRTSIASAFMLAEDPLIDCGRKKYDQIYSDGKDEWVVIVDTYTADTKCKYLSKEEVRCIANQELSSHPGLSDFVFAYEPDNSWRVEFILKKKHGLEFKQSGHLQKRGQGSVSHKEFESCIGDYDHALDDRDINRHNSAHDNTSTDVDDIPGMFFTSADVENPFHELVSMIKSSIIETENLVPRLKRSWADRSKKIRGSGEYISIEVGNQTWAPIMTSFHSDESSKEVPYGELKCVVERLVSHIPIRGAAAFCVRIDHDRNWHTELRLIADDSATQHYDLWYFPCKMYEPHSSVFDCLNSSSMS